MPRSGLAFAWALAVGCQGEPSPPPPPPRPEAGAPTTAAFDADLLAPSLDDAATAAPSDDVAPAEAQLEALGAIAAWQAVVDRDRYLLRRDQRGVIFGVVGAEVSVPGDGGAVGTAKSWVVDDTEGHGSLAVRVAWPARGASPAAGARVAVGGAWTLDDELRWVWQADAWSAVPPGPPYRFPEPAAAAHHIVGTGSAPSGWTTVAAAKDDGVIAFQIVGAPPVNEGDGWKIANARGDAPAAILFLPGERPSYGGHDLRSADERWRLKRGVTYWVRIGKVRRRLPDRPPTINARTAPVRW